MNNDKLKELLISKLPDAEFPEGESQFLNVIIKPEELHSLCEFLKNNPDTNFDYLFCLTALDYPTHLFTVYHMTSSQSTISLVVKVKIEDKETPSVDSVCDIWKTAEFHEREVYDLFGIKFNNHPDLRRILLEDNWEGYPLRKDYTDEANIVEL
ncbi:MAG: NADH-quinone oxidoreductase subunit C [Ignavibacteria bacterium]